MNTIQEIFTQYAPEYIQRFGDAVPNEHMKVIQAIIDCRTQNCGMAVYQCDSCHSSHWLFRSCGNRHCPVCQNHKTKMWLAWQMNRQLPGHHFMLTFTVPDLLRRFIRSNQRICYAAMFRASADTLKKLSADEKYVGGDLPGFFGVLHTWGRQLQYHPHIHYIVPGGALSRKENKWLCARIDFYLPVRAMSKMFKAKFLDEMKKADLSSSVPAEVWKIDWNVNCQAVGSSAHSVKYLAPYVFKVAISNSRIIKVQDRKVLFKYQKPHSNRRRIMALDVMEFLRRFLQHTLPTGFMKVRYYGFLNPASSVPLSKIRTLIELAYGFEIVCLKPESKPPVSPTCPHCGGNLKYLYSVLPFMMVPPRPG
jgi:hypothetical protein